MAGRAPTLGISAPEVLAAARRVGTASTSTNCRTRVPARRQAALAASELTVKAKEPSANLALVLQGGTAVDAIRAVEEEEAGTEEAAADTDGAMKLRAAVAVLVGPSPSRTFLRGGLGTRRKLLSFCCRTRST